MVDLMTAGVLAGALGASFFMAWTIGAGSAGSTPFAPAVGANAVSVMRAAFFVGILILLGAVFQGAKVSEAVGRELVAGVELSTGPAVVGFVVVTGVFAVGAGGLVWYRAGEDVVRALQHFAVAMGALVAFSAGGSQVGLAVGPLLPLLGGVPVLAVLVFGGIGLLVGAWTGATRLIKAVAQDYSSLGPRRSIAALIPSFVIAQIAILFGIPVSFNQIVVSAIVGSGAAAHGTGGISREKIGYTFAAWAASFAGAGILGYAGFTLVLSVV